MSLARKLEKVEPQLREVLFAILEEIEKQRKERVTKEEFKELRDIVKELAQAQKHTEQKIKELTEAQKQTEQRVKELAQAQKETEKRMATLEKRMEELAQAQKRTEQRVEELAQAQKRTEQRVEELAQAQKRTEQRVEELAQAQKRTEERVEELAQAQKRTEEELHKLIQEHRKTREQVGGLSATVGYILEDRAIKALPKLLKEEFDLTIEGKLLRKLLQDRLGRTFEVNILGKAVKNGKKYVIIGEAKAQLSKNKVREFARKVENLKNLFKEEPFPILITYMITETDVESLAKELGIKRIYYSFEF